MQTGLHYVSGGVGELPLVVNLAGTMPRPKAGELTTSDGNLGAEL